MVRFIILFLIFKKSVGFRILIFSQEGGPSLRTPLSKKVCAKTEGVHNDGVTSDGVRKDCPSQE